MNPLVAALFVIVAAEAFGQSGGNISNSVGSSSAVGLGGAGGAGGNASSIGQGGMGGAGGLGGIGYGGDASAVGGDGGTGYGGAGGIGQGGAANNTGNHQSSSMQFEQGPKSPAVFMSAPMPTAVCQATAGGFLSFIAGAGFAASFTLDQCEIREEARTLAGIGRADLALRVMCGNAKYTSQLAECRGL